MAAISFENALGVHSHALQLRAQRSEILANNLANSDTPGFKARDIEFQNVLQKIQHKTAVGHQQVVLATTHQDHIQRSASGVDDLLYRMPAQPSIDGNTVDSQIEQAEFARNSLNYNASFEFLNGKFKGLKNAIRGEEGCRCLTY